MLRYAGEGKKRVSDLELELQMVVSHHVGGGSLQAELALLVVEASL